jgi:hypothetical protein
MMYLKASENQKQNKTEKGVGGRGNMRKAKIKSRFRLMC